MAIFWYGIQTWLASVALVVLALAIELPDLVGAVVDPEHHLPHVHHHEHPYHPKDQKDAQ